MNTVSRTLVLLFVMWACIVGLWTACVIQYVLDVRTGRGLHIHCHWNYIIVIVILFGGMCREKKHIFLHIVFKQYTVSIISLSPTNTSPPFLLPSTLYFVCDLASGWAGSSGKQNKAIWFLRPCAAPTLNNRPGGNYPVPVPVPGPSFPNPRALLVPVRRTFTGHGPSQKNISLI